LYAAEIERATRLPRQTAARVIEDLVILEVVDEDAPLGTTSEGTGAKHRYALRCPGSDAPAVRGDAPAHLGAAGLDGLTAGGGSEPSRGEERAQRRKRCPRSGEDVVPSATFRFGFVVS